MLWELGVLSRPRAERAGVQLALPIPAGPAPPLPEPGRFERTVTDYETTGLSVGWHLVTLVRPALAPGVLTAAELRETADGSRVRAAGLVVARQRPATAGGIVFLLLEDETGMVNCIVRPEVYERHRAVVRADPLVQVWGRLERRERTLNVLVSRIERIEPPAEGPAAGPGAREALEMARLRAAAPEGQSFGRGRR
jgi:error-prone DNA polymerase